MIDDDKPSPRPWRVEPSESGYYLVRADGVTVGKMWKEADADLVRYAVNAYAALRGEIARYAQAVKLYEGAVSPYCAPELRPVLLAEARQTLEDATNEES